MNKKFAYYDEETLYKELKTSAKGLTLAQVEDMKRHFGSNQIRSHKKDTMAYRLRRAFINPFSVILIAIAIISFITDIILRQSTRMPQTTVSIITVMILIGGSIRLHQEMRAKNAADQLKRLIHTEVMVRREGILVPTFAEELVVGDVIQLAAGDLVPADIRLVKTVDLFVSQAAITGESSLQEKEAGTYKDKADIPLIAYENLAFMGTSIISGRGEGVVVAVGPHTVYGNLIGNEKHKKHAFDKGANDIAWVMIRFMMVLIPVVFIISGMTKDNWVEALVFSLSVAVGLTPEMLPMVITTCLAKGSLTMSKKQTIIKNINAMQGFGSMDILCMDKTGTITNEAIILEYYMDVLGNESQQTLDLAYLNSLYHSSVVNPIDKAILKCEEMPGKAAYFKQLQAQYTKVDEIPFEYNRKFVSTLIQDDTEQQTLVIKGAVEEVVARCHAIDYEGQVIPIENKHKDSVNAIVDEMLEDGMKVIAIAKKAVGHKGAIEAIDEDGMVLVGYLAFFDAPKKSAAQSIEALKKLQVRPKIITGDRGQIAYSICKRVGIDTQHMLTGSRLGELSDDALLARVEVVDIFAEITPSQKVRIITALQEKGHTVGFLGDGMNDIPALCAADVGISVDTAVDAAKDLSDVVLLEKDLNVLGQGILEGRKTFVNMLKYIKITGSSNLGNILAIVCASAFLPFLPMTAVQLLILNLLYDVLCIVLPWDDVDKDECRSPKEWSGRTLGKFMTFFGPISSLFDILTFVFLYFVLCPMATDGLLFHQLTDTAMQLKYIAIFQTGWFLESMWTQVLILHMLRTPKLPFVESKPSKPVLIVTLLGIAMFTLFAVTPISHIVGMTHVPLSYFGFLSVIVVSYMVLTTLSKKFYIKKYGELI